uniref:Uncharacterized protein n=1 Tax=Hyaloperonospora arabidopsidis (strain Emoy2) TaxID=559515 RepID=M4BUY5_HYAAE
MNVKCLNLTTRWVQYGVVLIFFITYRRRLVNYAADHQKFVLPSPFWWIMTYAASLAVSGVNKTIVVLQDKALLIAQQEHIVNLIGSLVAMFSIDSTDGTMDGYFVNGGMRIAYADIVAHIEDQGSWPKQLLAALSDDEKLDVVLETYTMNLALGLQSVRAERDANNLPRAQDAPPVLPAQPVKLSPRMFVKDVLAPHREQLAKTWTEEWIEQVESDHRQLRKTYDEDEELRAVIHKHDVNTFFGGAWGISQGGRFEFLRAFCDGLETAFETTSSAESDFSILKWEMNPNRTCLMHLSLEGIFQTKQRDVSTR